ncbi:MAG TPA: 3-deoxy-8-phosphooctulonate synthase [Planctomycetota bacterium]|nr:3-deoxy-8-phosphooctulonate synthase [Planctomycetota bacterium]
MNPPKPVLAGELVLPSKGAPLFVIAGPCVIESAAHALETAEAVAAIVRARGLPLVFKSSYDKANRSSGKSFRGIGMEKGLAALAEVRRKVRVPVLTDVHLPDEAKAAAEAVDVLQIPAFLCRQTDLLVACGETGRCVNVKKGQFLSPAEMGGALEKVRATGNSNVLVTERGTFFGYGRLVVDFSALPDLRAHGAPCVFDATHSVQRPGALGDRTGGDRERVPYLARAAVAAGFDGLFLEVHPDPDRAPSDGPNMVRLDALGALLDECVAIARALRRT